MDLLSTEEEATTLASSQIPYCCGSAAQLCLTLGDPMNHSTPGFPILHRFLEFAHTHVRWVSDAIQPSHPLLPLLLLPSIFHSIRVFSNELALCIRWPKYWGFKISPSDEYSGLISLGVDWFLIEGVSITVFLDAYIHTFGILKIHSSCDYFGLQKRNKMDIEILLKWSWLLVLKGIQFS